MRIPSYYYWFNRLTDTELQCIITELLIIQLVPSPVPSSLAQESVLNEQLEWIEYK